jgi:hypothetical protein
MLPWKNSWFQIAFFAWIVSGALLVVDYAPRIQVTTGWMKAFEGTPKQPTAAPVKPSPPIGQQPAPAKQSAPPVETPLPSHKVDSAAKSSVPARPPATETPVKKAADASKTSATKPAVAIPPPAKAEKPQGGAAGTWEWYEKAAADGNSGAAETIKGAANQGHVDAQYIVGRMYEKGEGVKQDSNEAMKWYGLAAAQGNQSAQQALDRLRARRSH